MFSDFDNYISSNFSTNYWSDEGISRAADMVHMFTESDWDELNNSLLGRMESWQIKCAETLGDVEEKLSVDILLQLLCSESVKVKLAALDSLNALLACGLRAADHEDKIRQAIEQVKPKSSVESMMTGSLKEKL